MQCHTARYSTEPPMWHSHGGFVMDASDASTLYGLDVAHTVALCEIRPSAHLAPCFCTAPDALEVARMLLNVHMYRYDDVIKTGTGRQFCTLGRISPSATVVCAVYLLAIHWLTCYRPQLSLAWCDHTALRLARVIFLSSPLCA